MVLHTSSTSWSDTPHSYETIRNLAIHGIQALMMCLFEKSNTYVIIHQYFVFDGKIPSKMYFTKYNNCSLLSPIYSTPWNIESFPYNNLYTREHID